MPNRLLFGAPTAMLNSASPIPSSARVKASSAATRRAEERPDEPSAVSVTSAAVVELAVRRMSLLPCVRQRAAKPQYNPDRRMGCAKRKLSAGTTGGGE